MASANYSLASLKMGNVGVTGQMGTSLTEFDDPVRDTCVVTMEAGTAQDFFSEIADDQYYSVNIPGKITLTADFYAKSAAQLQMVFGGTVTGETWQTPASQVTLEQSIELTHKNGNKLSIIRASVTCTFEWNFKRTALPLIHLTSNIYDRSNWIS